MSTAAKLHFGSPRPLGASIAVEDAQMPESPHGRASFGASRFTVPAAESTPPHRHAVTEMWLIKAGRGAMQCDCETFAVVGGDIVYIHPNVTHSIHNDSDTDLEIFSIWGF